MNDRIYAIDDEGQTVYRIPGMRHGDGQIDSDESPVWLLGDPADAPNASHDDYINPVRYYIVETIYIGPNGDEDRFIDADTIEIRTEPAIDNGDRIRKEGWCGSANDWSVYAHGEFRTLEAARSALLEKFSPVRDADANGDPFEPMDLDVVEVYRPGQYAPMTSDATDSWSYPGLEEEITPEATDERITELVAEFTAELNSMGLAPHPKLREIMEEYRQSLIDEAEEDDE